MLNRKGCYVFQAMSERPCCLSEKVCAAFKIIQFIDITLHEGDVLSVSLKFIPINHLASVNYELGI